MNITKARIDEYNAYRAGLTPNERGTLDQELEAFCGKLQRAGQMTKRLGPNDGKELLIAILRWQVKHPKKAGQ